MLDSDSLTAATDGADVLYAVVGLPYAAQVWQRDWPPAMRNLISAVEANGCKLVFLDNVYAYGLVAGAMTEATAYNPCSRKGEVRARIATELMEADKTGRSRHIAEGQHSGRLEIIDELFADDYVRHDLRPTQASPGPAGMKRISPRTSAPVDPASGSRRRPNHG